jgi:EAL domain-containing protein (putative c-di-GMP-specific phosphodiesterase class I)
VVAEGIETQADLDALKQLGCDVGQGFFLSHPVPAAGLSAWARTNGGPTFTPTGAASAGGD